MFKKKHYLALGAVALVVLLIFSLPQRATSRLKLAAGSLFLPLFGLLNTVQQLPGNAADAVMPRRALLKEADDLRNENQQLRFQMMQAAATARENDQLRALLGWQRQVPWQLKLANVVMRDPANWWRTLQIDLGSRDGVRENLPVLTPTAWWGVFPPSGSPVPRWFCWATPIAASPDWSPTRRMTSASSAPAGRWIIRWSS
jgi:rod shape-determining protein MreC